MPAINDPNDTPAIDEHAETPLNKRLDVQMSVYWKKKTGQGKAEEHLANNYKREMLDLLKKVFAEPEGEKVVDKPGYRIEFTHKITDI